MAYNLSMLSNSGSFFDIIYFLNYASDNLLGNGISMVIFIILLLIFSISRGGDFIRSLMTASFISFMLSLFLVYSGIASDMLMYTYGITTGFCILYLYAVGE